MYVYLLQEILDNMVDSTPSIASCDHPGITIADNCCRLCGKSVKCLECGFVQFCAYGIYCYFCGHQLNADIKGDWLIPCDHSSMVCCKSKCSSHHLISTPNELVFCIGCAQKMKCAKCDAPRRSDAHFCTKCQHRLDNLPQPPVKKIKTQPTLKDVCVSPPAYMA